MVVWWCGRHTSRCTDDEDGFTGVGSFGQRGNCWVAVVVNYSRDIVVTYQAISLIAAKLLENFLSIITYLGPRAD